MYNSSHSMILPPLNKREFVDEQGIAIETSHLSIRSPTGYYGNYKRPRYETAWTFDELCSNSNSPLSTVDLEVNILTIVIIMCQ